MTTRKAETIVAVLLTAAAAVVLTIHATHAGALWRDECGALAIAQLGGIRAMFDLFPHEAFPLAFPLTVRAWLVLAGDSDASLRIFGAAVAALLIAALWVHARLSRTYPFASLSLFALSPLVMFVSSIRGYGLGCAATLFALAAHRRLIDGVTGRRLLAASVASLIAAHSAMHDAALLLAIGGAAAAVSWRRHGFRSAAAILGCDALVAASLAVYIPSLSRARLWDISQRALPWHATIRSVADAIGGMRFLLALAVPTAAAVVVALIGLWRETAAERDRLLFYLSCLSLMLITYYVWLQVLGYSPRTWYFVPVVAVGTACVDGLLAGTTLRLWRQVIALVCVGIACWLLPPTVGEARVRATNVDLVAAQLARAAAPHDLVVVNPWYCGVSFARYDRGPAPWTTLPPVGDHRMHRYDLLMSFMSRRDAVLPLLQRVESTLRSGNTVWLAGSFDTPPSGEILVVPPPAPDPVTGWADAPYLLFWSQQLGHLLGSRSVLVQEQLLMQGPTSGYETLLLRAFRGWRDEAPRATMGDPEFQPRTP